jgi:hypothetical protein
MDGEREGDEEDLEIFAWESNGARGAVLRLEGWGRRGVFWFDPRHDDDKRFPMFRIRGVVWVVKLFVII